MPDYPKEYRLRKYEERFLPSTYNIDSSNLRIPVLNSIADDMNRMLRQGLSLEKFEAIFAALNDFVEGRL